MFTPFAKPCILSLDLSDLVLFDPVIFFSGYRVQLEN